MLRLLTLALVLSLSVVFTAAAQEMSTPDRPNYDLWQSVASRAETAVDEQIDETEVFETLRTRLATFRAEFQDARQINAERIATLREQLDALGPVPETGSEAEQVAARRSELERQLATLQAPVQVADEAFRRADGLISEIDQIIRDRQTRRLLALGPSPLNPVHWGPAVQEFGATLADVGSESVAFGDSVRRQQLRENLPLVLLLGAVALVLMARGRRWAGMIAHRARRLGGHSVSVVRFVVSLGRIVLPLIGVVALSQALRATGMAGVRGEQLLNALPIWGGILLGFRWLSERLFSRDEDEALIVLAPERRAEARFYLLMLSLLFVLRGVLALLFSFSDVSAETRAVVAFPVVVLIGLILFRVGQILRGYSETYADEGEEEVAPTSLGRALRLTGIAIMAVSIAAPLMAAVGYASAGNALLYPTVISLLILGLVMALQRFFGDLYGWLTGQGAQGRDALVPVLVGFVLVLAATPLLALAWGARVADLTEIWSAFSRGFVIGETRISPSDFLMFALIFSGGYVITRLVQGALRSNVLPKTRIDIGGQNAIVSGLGYVGIFLAALAAITGAGIDLSSLAIVAGALSVGIGFGLQNIVSNFVSGIILLIERPISEGDWIEVGGRMGYVRDISVRSTRIETFDRTDVIVPNADLVSGTVTNFTRGNTVGRLIVKVGVAYGTDTRRVDTILREIAEAQPMVLANPPPMILFASFGADALEFEVRMILRDVNWLIPVQNDVNHAIAERFAEEGIEVPFAQRDIWLRNPEAWSGGGGGKAAAEATAPAQVAATRTGSRSDAQTHTTVDDMQDPDADAAGEADK
ncbi:DUF3772 domain-containing protein [Sulfitobacter sabulilitoris]|uniref:DUF3772 domain-containing protein n=1 Tax=Sulfitobacter sabulilitoris TaxID=2562655 RepID=A0A5S3PK95_9RHOB|nr:DUF3772 domain-containing protein [Sulfitobacter sabulilitoris]TMM54676.1 DUF3772 domain-containing protein [Sulfitobacter sabulilitoris]